MSVNLMQILWAASAGRTCFRRSSHGRLEAESLRIEGRGFRAQVMFGYAGDSLASLEEVFLEITLTTTFKSEFAATVSL